MKANLRRVLDESAGRQFARPQSSPSDRDLLDAYSEGVAGAAERVTPAVVSLETARRKGAAERPAGTGSGFVFASDGIVPSRSI